MVVSVGDEREYVASYTISAIGFETPLGIYDCSQKQAVLDIPLAVG